MEQDYFQQSNMAHRLPDGRSMPRRLSNDAQDKRSFENFYPIHFRDRRFWIPLSVIVISLNIIWWRLPLPIPNLFKVPLLGKLHHYFAIQ